MGDKSEWHQNAVIYQVPVGLLKDSNGNGWGDLRGVTESLEHIHRLGANALWLQPFYRSPYADGGYDISDHTDVSDRFGTLEDFDDLVRRADELGIEVILDLVVQHTSTQHRWFHDACRDRGSRFRDFYIWADDPRETIVEPVFPDVDDTVWTWCEEAGQYYRHTFYHHEPDLNLGNPEVREAIRAVMEFWLEKGVAGFRVDAAPFLVRQAAQADPRDDGFWFLQEMRQTVQKHRPDGILMAEANVDPHQYADYFGEDNRFTTMLNFWLNNHLFLALARGEGEPLARALKTQPMPPDSSQYAIWLRNHDELDLSRLTDDEREETMAVFAPEPQMRAFGRGIRRRLAPMMRDPRQLKLAMFLLGALPGTPVVLYGDEIGMGENLELPDRASVRTPMQWSEQRNAGFSTAPSMDLVHPVIESGPFGYHYVNVDAESKNPQSLLETLKKLFALRGELGPFHAKTTTIVEVASPHVLALRHHARADVLTIANLCQERLDVALPEEHRADWEEVLADHAYDEDAVDGTVHLHGYGYRWFRRRG